MRSLQKGARMNGDSSPAGPFSAPSMVTVTVSLISWSMAWFLKEVTVMMHVAFPTEVSPSKRPYTSYFHKDSSGVHVATHCASIDFKIFLNRRLLSQALWNLQVAVNESMRPTHLSVISIA